MAKVITVYSESEYASESLGEGMMVDNIQTRSHGGEKKKLKVFAARSFLFWTARKGKSSNKKKLQIMYKVDDNSSVVLSRVSEYDGNLYVYADPEVEGGV